MKLPGIAKRKKYSIFLSAYSFFVTEVGNGVCNTLISRKKSPESFTIIDDIRTDKSAFKNIEPGDAVVILDAGMGIVKLRFLPKAIKSKDIEKALKISIEAEIGHSIDKYYFSYDLLLKGDNGNTYILVYADRQDVILTEKSFKKYNLNVKRMGHFTVEFLNALISLGFNIPVNVLYISKDYYMLLKLTEQLIDYKKVDLYDFDSRKHEILEDIRMDILALGLEDISLIYSHSLFSDYKEFYEELKNSINIKSDIFPPYEFDCYIFNVSGSML